MIYNNWFVIMVKRLESDACVVRIVVFVRNRFTEVLIYRELFACIRIFYTVMLSQYMST